MYSDTNMLSDSILFNRTKGVKYTFYPELG